MTLAATPARAEWVSRTEVWLHTDVTVTIPASKAASLAFDAVFAVMADVERLANEW